MNKEDMKSMNTNINTLASNTENLEQLIESLQKRRLIEEHEKQHILTLPTKYKRCCEIYLLLLRKGPEAFDALYQALLETKNDTVAEILKPDESANKRTFRTRAIRRSDSERDREYGKTKYTLKRSLTQVDSDIQITTAHIKDIVNILEITIAHAEWPVIVNDLLDSSTQNELNKLPSSTPYEVLFEKTLHLWISTKGHRATLNTFLSILAARRQHDTADELKSKYQKIFLAF